MMKLLNSNSIVGFVVGSAVCLTACLSIGSSDSEKVKDQRPVVSSVTMSPDSFFRLFLRKRYRFDAL